MIVEIEMIATIEIAISAVETMIGGTTTITIGAIALTTTIRIGEALSI
jgi:hypothetical protein